MDEEEFSTFTKALKTYYPRENLLPTKESMELWYQQLKDIGYNDASLALVKYVSLNKFSPTIADIREYSSSVVNEDIPDWGSAWQEVMRAISYYGAYREDEANNSFDELTKEAVKRLGFKNICYSENIAADRARFRDIYIILSDRKKSNMQISTDVSRCIAMRREQVKQLQQQSLRQIESKEEVK